MKLNQYAHLISFSLVMQIKHSKPLESDINCFHISVHTYYHIRPLGFDDMGELNDVQTKLKREEQAWQLISLQRQRNDNVSA